MFQNNHALAALVGLAAILTSCSVKEDLSNCKSKVTVNLQAFDIEQSSFTKASATNPPHRIVFKAFAADSTIAYETVQCSGTSGYGTLNFELAPGTYDFVAVAHDVADSTVTSAAATITSSSLASVPDTLVEEVFSAVKSVTVKPSTAFSTAMTLPRVISCFRLVMKGAFPSDAKRVRIVANTSGTPDSECPTFDPSTGLATFNRQYVKEIETSGQAGKIDLGFKLNMFLTASEQTIDITASALDSLGNVIVTHTFDDVPMQQNRRSVATGYFFNGSGTGSFAFETSWNNYHPIDY